MRLVTALVSTLIITVSSVQGATLSDDEQAFKDLYEQLVEINTTLSSGSCTEAAEAMAVQLKSSGIPEEDIHIIVPDEWPKQGNLVAMLRGTSPENESILMLAHIDVVEAKREDWVRDPFTLIEEDGYFFGRGTADDKSMAAIFVDIMVRLSESGYQPERNLKLALTCGEETPNTFNGASYLLEHHRDLLDAKFAINEGGSGRLDSKQQPVYNAIEAGEKVYQDFKFEVTNPGGHSSRPRKDNAINQLALALGKVADHEFPIEFNATTRGYFKILSGMKEEQVAADMLAILQSPPDADALERIKANPGYNSILHTTCVTTMVSAGHAPNALPQRATANVNCRIFPGHPQEDIRQALIKLIDDPQVVVTFDAPPESTSPPPPLTSEVLEPIERVTAAMWLGVPVLPTMIAGGTDGRFLTPAGIPTYGVSGIFREPGKVNAHGLNEKILVKSLFEGREFLDRLIKIYIGGE